jgi:hypothetical protein
MTAAAVPDAHAQYGGGGLIPVFVAGAIVDGGVGHGALVSGIGSTVYAAKGGSRPGQRA